MNKIGGGVAWTGSDLAKTGDQYHIVDPALVKRLAQELPFEFQISDTAKDADEFLVQAKALLTDIAAVISDRAQSGPGLVILVGAGLEKLTDGQLTAMLYSLSLILGRPMVQNLAGQRLVPIRDERPADAENARGYTTKDRMLLHTDPSDLASFLCLSQAAAGGANLFTSAAAVHDVIANEAPELLHEYYRLWDWNVRALNMPSTSPIVSSPIFSFYAGELCCRYGSSLLRKGASSARRQLTIEQVKALDLFEEVAQRPELLLRYTLRRGESVWMNNYRVLHGREAFEDGSSTDHVRQLMRVWVWFHSHPVLAPAFASFDYHIFGHDRAEIPKVSARADLGT